MSGESHYKFGKPVKESPRYEPAMRWSRVWLKLAGMQVGLWLPIHGLRDKERRSLYNMARVRKIPVAIRKGTLYMQRRAGKI